MSRADECEIARRTLLLAAGAGMAAMAGCSSDSSDSSTEAQDQNTPSPQEETTPSSTPTDRETATETTAADTPQYPEEEGESTAEQRLQSNLNDAMMIEIENPQEYVSIPENYGDAQEGYEGMVSTVDLADTEVDGQIATHVNSYLIALYDSQNFPEGSDADPPDQGEYNVSVYALTDEWSQGYSEDSEVLSQDAVERFYDENISGGVVQSWNMPDDLLQLATE